MMVGCADTPDGGHALILGMSKANVHRLTHGEPITLTDKIHHLPKGWSILILYGDTELDIAAQLKKAGAIGSSTQIKVDPRLGS